ncbi:MAG: PAS domain S-box protein [Nitrospirales bacterium]
MDNDPIKERLEKEIEALKAEMGELRAVQGIHKHTEEGLQAIELQLAGIIHSAMDAIITVDENQQIVLFNTAAEGMFGYMAPEVMGTSIDRFIPERFQSKHHEHIQQFGQAKVTNRRMGALGAISGVRCNGEEFPLEASISQVVVSDRRLFTVILRDITERKEAERILQETQRVLSTLIENLPGMVYRGKNDQDRTMEVVSKGSRLLTGYSSEELVGNQKVSYGRDVVVPEDRERLWKEVQEAHGEHRSYQLSYKIKTADGSSKWVWEQGTGVRSPDGDVCALEGYVFDVTQVKALEDRLQKTERLAELGTLASGMAHEIGTPMNVILGRAEFLIRKVSDETIKKGLGTIVTQVERITKIMNQLLSFARKRPIERRSTDLIKVIHDVLDVVLERIKAQGIKTVIDAAPEVPPVFADPDQMTQVLLNLVVNACHAMPDGGTLRIGLYPRNKQVELTVADTGCGIPPSDVSKLFDPFFTTKAVGEGTGLGLTVVHGIIQEHEGTISVKSEAGKGTTFYISLPIIQVHS